MRRIDLHTHTDRSDGGLSPTALVQEAAAIGLVALAVTDHDTTGGLEEAAAAARSLGVEAIAGCEISTSVPGGQAHVLAYGFDPDDARLQAFLATVRVARERRNAAMLGRLADLGCPLLPEEVARHATGNIVARPHMARAMVDRGYVPDVRAAFERFLGDTAAAFVPPDMPAPEEAVEVTARAGGVAVIAHPRQLRLADRAAFAAFLAPLCAAGLGGVEVEHPSHKPEHRAFFAGVARDLDLVPTGGSDFHGVHKPHIALGEGDGTIDVRYETWERLRERRWR